MSALSRLPRPTTLGKAVLIIAFEILLNVTLWVLAAILFAPDPSKRRILSLCVVAWTLGLRHGLDADHICAIDNAIRRLVALGQRPVTVGMWFSFGHSTIVIVVTAAVAISTSVADHLDGVGSIGGVVGVCVSASFLFILAIINSIILASALRRRRAVRKDKDTQSSAVESTADDCEASDTKSRSKIAGGPFTSCLTRVFSPVFRLIDAPWKMYPVGILFGFGFDTASEIVLLGIAAIARGPSSSSDGEEGGDGRISNGEILVLPFLFTAGMSLVDSLDSVVMLWAYAFPGKGVLEEASGDDGKSTSTDDDGGERKQGWRRRFALLEPRSQTSRGANVDATPEEEEIVDTLPSLAHQRTYLTQAPTSEIHKPAASAEEDVQGQLPTEAGESTAVDMTSPTSPHGQTIAGLSIALTVLSIVVALAISIIEFMGLAAEKCSKCADQAENDPGLPGRWWRFWIAVNDNSGYIGAGIVGVMLLMIASRVLGKRLLRYRRKRLESRTSGDAPGHG